MDRIPVSDINPYQSPSEESLPGPAMPTADRWIWLWVPITGALSYVVIFGAQGWGIYTPEGVISFVLSLIVYVCGLARIGIILWWQIRWSRFRKTLSIDAVLGFLLTIMIAVISVVASCIDQLTNPKSQAPGHWSALAMVVIFALFYELVWWPTRRSLG